MGLGILNQLFDIFYGDYYGVFYGVIYRVIYGVIYEDFVRKINKCRQPGQR